MIPRLVRSSYLDKYQTYMLSVYDQETLNVCLNHTPPNAINNIIKFLLDQFTAPVFIEIGAGNGLSTMEIADHILAKGGLVYAFEPNLTFFLQLNTHIFLNQLPNVTTYHKACGATKGTIEYPNYNFEKITNNQILPLVPKYDDKNATPFPVYDDTKKNVELIPLDEVILPKTASLVQINVNGMENDVITGAKQFLQTHQFPPILLTSWDHSIYRQSHEEAQQSLLEQNYEMLTLSNNLYLWQHPTNKYLDLVQQGENTQLVLTKR